jgi:hypothetical protein
MRRCALAFVGLAVSGLMLGCGDSDSDSDPDSERATGIRSDVLTACNDLCDAQAGGEGCTEEFAKQCKESCDVKSPKTEECAEATIATYECEQEMTWRCPDGSDFTVSTDGLCDEEQESRIRACSQ